MKKTYIIFALTFLLFSTTAIATTTIEIQPSTITVDQGDTFTISLYVVPGEEVDTVATDLISWNKNILECLDINKGDFFPNPLVWIEGTIKNNEGKIELMCMASQNTTTEPGILCNITFKSIAGGNTAIVINEEKYGVALAGAPLDKQVVGNMIVTSNGDPPPNGGGDPPNGSGDPYNPPEDPLQDPDDNTTEPLDDNTTDDNTTEPLDDNTTDDNTTEPPEDPPTNSSEPYTPPENPPDDNTYEPTDENTQSGEKSNISFYFLFGIMALLIISVIVLKLRKATPTPDDGKLQEDEQEQESEQEEQKDDDDIFK